MIKLRRRGNARSHNSLKPFLKAAKEFNVRTREHEVNLTAMKAQFNESIPKEKYNKVERAEIGANSVESLR